MYMWAGTIRKSQRKKALHQSFQCIIYHLQNGEAAKALNMTIFYNWWFISVSEQTCPQVWMKKQKHMMIKSMCAGCVWRCKWYMYLRATCMPVVVMTSIHKGFWYLRFTVFMRVSPPMLFWPVQNTKHLTLLTVLPSTLLTCILLYQRERWCSILCGFWCHSFPLCNRDKNNADKPHLEHVPVKALSECNMQADVCVVYLSQHQPTSPTFLYLPLWKSDQMQCWLPVSKNTYPLNSWSASPCVLVVNTSSVSWLTLVYCFNFRMLPLKLKAFKPMFSSRRGPNVRVGGTPVSLSRTFPQDMSANGDTEWARLPDVFCCLVTVIQTCKMSTIIT